MTAVDPALRATRTTCPYCGVGCGVLATPDNNGGAGIAADPDHPTPPKKPAIKDKIELYQAIFETH